MRIKASALVLIGLGLGSGAIGAELSLQSEEEKISYSLGYQLGGDFKRQGQGLKPEVMVRGVQDGLSGAQPALSSAEMRELLVLLKQKVAAAQQEERERVSRAAAQAGKTFLAENAGKEGVHSLPSGLQYQVIREGTGEKTPGPAETVTVHYRGTLIDGSQFDSSYERDVPATFRLDRVIKGWTEGLQLMKPGAKYKLFVPSELGYGARGGGKIPPNSALIFEVELLSIGPGGGGAPPKP